MSGDRYESPLCQRYASEWMQRLFSADRRTATWRRLWVSLARAEHALGLPVTESQVAALAANVENIDREAIAAREKQVRHDVMAHVYGFGLAAPEAAGIIHLGATSCYVTDNADLILYREALRRLAGELLFVMRALAQFADRYKGTATLGYTHFQPAQPVTVGKRACLYLQDFWMDYEALTRVADGLRLLGCRGTTGTEASFLALFDGDGAKIDRMNALIAADFDFPGVYAVASQTYPRKVDSGILAALSGVAESAYRFAQDLRLLQHEREIEEPFETEQIGSSAMAYKRNPMRAERICSLARYVIANAANAPMTASVQWLERTLDDSANRRISLPESFLAVDAILRLLQNVIPGLVVNERMIEKNLAEYLPFMATENLLMEAVKRGADRQAMHGVIRTHSLAASARMKQGEPCDLLERLAEDPAFPLDRDAIQTLLDPAAFIGRAAGQVTAFLATLPDVSAAVAAPAIEV